MLSLNGRGHKKWGTEKCTIFLYSTSPRFLLRLHVRSPSKQVRNPWIEICRYRTADILKYLKCLQSQKHKQFSVT